MCSLLLETSLSALDVKSKAGLFSFFAWFLLARCDRLIEVRMSFDWILKQMYYKELHVLTSRFPKVIPAQHLC